MTLYCMVNEETLERTPEEVRAYLRYLRGRIGELEGTEPQRRVEELEATVRKLKTQIADLKAEQRQQAEQIQHLQRQLADARARLRTNSTNSSLPPSSDRFHRKRRPPPAASTPRKKRGAQPGHPRQQRPLVPADSVSQTIPCLPTTCRRCGKPLCGSDPQPLRHQVAELPVVVPTVVEYQLHRLICPCCHSTTCGMLPPGVQGHFAPRLEATLALLAGQYRLGLRPVAALAAQMWGLDISTGMVSKLRRRTAAALESPFLEVAFHVRGHHVNIDETRWRQARQRFCLWAVLTPKAGLFKIAKRRTAQVAKTLLGERFSQVATCDRLKSYWWIKRLQWCWAHLRRDFQAMIDRGGTGKAIGEGLLLQSDRLFELWHRLKQGKLSRQRLKRGMKPVREAVKQTLQAGVACGCGKTAGTCQELLEHEGWLWTFVDTEGVEPTNNEAERAERHGVLWRKVSGGTDSAAGSRFVERILTVVETCHRQGKKALDYLSICIAASRLGQTPPPLLSDTS
jgi:transposase